ncbi:hypothetical protein BJ742DRAFT_836829 [Cladochytrium replicatum]|nr:hypothetical protein BJ742DRAFT_836829 [Cladochytrium replicatum]
MSRPGISSSDAPDPTPESTAATPAMMNVATEIFHGVSLEAFNRKNRRRGARRVQHPLNTLLQVYNGILCVTLLLWLAAIGLHIGERLELFKSDLINTVWIIILFTEASVENVVRVWVDLRGGSSNRASIGSAQVQTDCGALGTTVHNENPPNSLLVNTQTAPAQQFQTLGHFQAFARECNSTTPSESNSTTHPRIHYGSDQEEIQFCRSRRVSFIGRRLEDQESPKEGP